MNKGRLEAFSDGVLAIIITIMVLAMDTPEEVSLKALYPVLPVFVSYLLSYIYVGIYWINHHHIMQVTRRINGEILWANLHLLFWLSLIPFTTAWVGKNHLAPIPIAFYGGVLLMSAIAFRILEGALIKSHDKSFPLRKLHREGRKEKLSIFFYFIAIPLSFVSVWICIAIYFAMACWWVMPSKELEREVEEC
ncbi:putative membrane protein [Balneicella halophila]|uniref:Putative membrane protein n=1 Tax=Balneicella halophila TaxID=1537566 RepID=A0A7L4URZ0_BALHA|nr:TMEM175 family protein [Balneicella halophila]PVX52191.1 putative membrane protein [Balneicella halophila]